MKTRIGVLPFEIERERDTAKIWMTQGEVLKREGIVDVRVVVENKKPRVVKIGGEAVVVFKTSMTM